MLRSLVVIGAALVAASAAQAADPRPAPPSGTHAKGPDAGYAPSPWAYVPPLHYEARPFRDYRPFRTYHPFNYLRRPGLAAPTRRSGAVVEK